MDNKQCLCSFLFFILLWFHLGVKFVNAAGPVGEEGCPVCIDPVDDMDWTTLKIGIPGTKVFPEFVHVYEHLRTNKTCVNGFSIDVFRAALQLLPFKLQPEFIPLPGTYDELLQNIPAKFEGVVGDMTITANRSSLVDFTMSYADSSVYVVVPVKHVTRKNMWTFLKPLNWDLWLAFIMTSIFVGSLIGAIEIRSNPTNIDFAGPLHQKLGMMVWYPLSMLVLPERRMVVSRWSKLVLVVWLFMAVIIVQSYTANLTTMLTIDQLQPYFNKKGNYVVGYHEGSFVGDYLKQQMNFTESRLRAYSTIEDYHKALSNGSVAAIYDELPYIKLFLRKYGSQYTVLGGPILRTNGFGFAFPLNSSLVPHISRAILNVTDGGKMDELERKYFGRKESSEVEISRLAKETICLDIKKTPSLDAYNFLGLFIVTVSISLASFVCSEFWRQCIDQRAPYTGETNVMGDPPMIDNQSELPPTTSNQSVENVSIKEEGEQEQEQEDEDEDEDEDEGEEIEGHSS